MAYKTRTVLKTYFETGDKPPEAEFVDLLDSIKVQSKGNTFTPAIVFDVDEKYFSQYTQSGTLTISLGANPNGDNSSIYVPVATDGSDIDFPAEWIELKNEYVNDDAIYGLIIMYDGVTYQYSLYRIKSLIEDAVWDNQVDCTVNGNDLIGASGSSKAESLNQNIVSDGYVDCILKDSLGVIGLNYAGGLEVYTDFDFGIYYQNSVGEIRVVLGGVSVTPYSRALTGGDVDRMRIERSGTDILFKWFDGTTWETLQTENSVSTADLYIKAAFITAGVLDDTIIRL